MGFGDFHPQSDTERALAAFVLMFGVAVFSYFMGVFIEILQLNHQLNYSLDEGDQLSKFWGLLRQFNNDLPIN